MPELKLTLKDDQISRIKKAVRDKYGDDERTDGQLVKFDMKQNLKSLVQNYEKKVEVSKIKLTDF